MTHEIKLNGEPHCIVDQDGRVTIYKYVMIGTIVAGRVPCFDQPKLYDSYMLWRKQEGVFADMSLDEFIERMSGIEE